MVNKESEYGKKETKNPARLTPEERMALEQLAHGEAPFSQRALALLALDQGATRVEAGNQSGLTLGQVRYWQAKFLDQRMNIFPQVISNTSGTDSQTDEQNSAETSSALESVPQDSGEKINKKARKDKKKGKRKKKEKKTPAKKKKKGKKKKKK